MFVVPIPVFAVSHRHLRPLSFDPVDVFGLGGQLSYGFANDDELDVLVYRSDDSWSRWGALNHETERRRIAAHELAAILQQQQAEEHQHWIRQQLIRTRRERLALEEQRRHLMNVELRRRQAAQLERRRQRILEEGHQANLINALLVAQAIVEARTQAQNSSAPVEQPVASRVHFSARPAPPSTPSASSSVPLKSALKPQPAPSTSGSSIRIPIRESKGKASSHVRVTSHLPEPLPAADAIAALTILETDLDALNLGLPAAALKHQLTRLLEQVDAIESGGHEAVRDVRRALVQRLEGALEVLERGDELVVERPKQVGIKIVDRSSEELSVPVHIPAADPVASTAVEGYVVDDYLAPVTGDATHDVVAPGTVSADVGDAAPVGDTTPDESARSHDEIVSTQVSADVTAAAPVLETVPDVSADASGSEATVSPTPLEASYPPAQFFDVPSRPPVASSSSSSPAHSVQSLPDSTKPSDVDSDWESGRRSEGEDAFEVV